VYLTIKDLSERYQIKPSTLYAWAAQEKIPGTKIHGLLRFDSDDIARWEASFRRNEKKARPVKLNATKRDDLDVLIASAKRASYTPRHGETRPLSSLNRKEGDNGAL
jgi:predicted site-specific integrase-resolvase